MSILRTCHVQLTSENSGHVISISIFAVMLVNVHEFISYWVNADSGFRHDYYYVEFLSFVFSKCWVTLEPCCFLIIADSGLTHDYVFVITMLNSYHLYSLNVCLCWSLVIF